MLNDTLELEDAGVIGVELEVVPRKVAAEITKRTKIITMSMGSGSDCDAQYLFANDILGTHRGHYPRHSKVYRNLLSDYEKIQKERISAFKEFKKDTEDRNFNDPKLTVDIEDVEFKKFMRAI